MRSPARGFAAHRPIAFLATAMLFLAGCATTPATTGQPGISSSPFQEVGTTTARQAPAEDYRVAAEDELDITVYRVPELSKSVEVSAAGEIDLPLIGTTKVAGMTVAEIEKELERKLGADYLQRPEVDVRVKEAVSQRVTVEGEVNSPGIYTTNGRTTLLQAIVQAGGLSELADARGVVVFRTIEGKRHAAVFDYRRIRGGRSEDPIIMGGDIIAVDRSGVQTALKTVRESMGLAGLFLPLL